MPLFSGSGFCSSEALPDVSSSRTEFVGPSSDAMAPSAGASSWSSRSCSGSADDVLAIGSATSCMESGSPEVDSDGASSTSSPSLGGCSSVRFSGSSDSGRVGGSSSGYISLMRCCSRRANAVSESTDNDSWSGAVWVRNSCSVSSVEERVSGGRASIAASVSTIAFRQISCVSSSETSTGVG